MKHTTNTLSTLYRSIDQTKISDKAKETLKKLRLATGNFVGKDEEAKQLFVDFFNKLKESKPIAVKTTPEYKKALRDAQKERGKALGEKRKKESQDKKGTGNDIDANRPAKPYGWRMRGKHNYKKPTRADITEGRAYYEGRVNRADVKRKKYPMLERGGYMAEGGEIMSKAERYANNPNWTNEKLLKEYNEAKFNLKQFEMGYLKPSKIIGTGYKSSAIAKKLAKEYCEDQVQIFKTALELRGVMAEGGMINHGFRSGDKIIEIYKGYGIIESKDVVEVINPSQGSRYVVDHGNTMDEQIDGAKRMIDNMTPIELVDRIEIGTDRNGSMDRRGVEYAKGGTIEEGDKVIITTDSLGKKYQGMQGEIMSSKLLNNKYSIRLEDGMTMAFDRNEFRHNSINPKYAKGGTIGGMSTYVSARDIEEIKLTINGDKKTLKGSDLMDGVYVKKSSLKEKFDAYKVEEKLANMAYDVWDKLKIESGSQIYASDKLQENLSNEYEKEGIDSLFKKYSKTQRKAIAEALTDENQHSLRQYLALRGYLGDEEYDDYKRLYDRDFKQGNKYINFLNPNKIKRLQNISNQDDERALNSFNKLKEEGKLKRYVDTRGDGKKYFDTIVPNNTEKGYWKRYESSSKGDLGTLQNEFLSEKDVLNWLKKTMPKLEKDKMAEGGEVFYAEKHKND